MAEKRFLSREERILIPSPKVATYDLQPEMSAVEVTDRVLAEIASDRFDVIIMNYANGDMVGHTDLGGGGASGGNGRRLSGGGSGDPGKRRWC